MIYFHLKFDVAKFRKWFLHPLFAALGEDGLEVAFKQRTGVLEVLFGVGLGGGESGKRFVQIGRAHV